MLKKIKTQGKTLTGKIIWQVRGGYKPREFWDKWSRVFMDDPWQVKIHPQHEWLLSKLTIRPESSILEVGCGFGRNIKFMLDHGISTRFITGVDISPFMIRKAKKYLLPNKVNLKTADILKLPFENKQFDIVFTHGVLMHVKPENVKTALKELVRVANEAIILIEQNYGGNEYTFMHEYKKLFKDIKLNVVEYRVSKKLGLDLIYAEIR